ncbi:transmembrane protein 26-like [Babylonia areolata]|uniref:transmembrane protein 26-like n=1 Tax=Babylonia areolata TaxID=304850 RepID=UPI003FD127EE
MDSNDRKRDWDQSSSEEAAGSSVDSDTLQEDMGRRGSPCSSCYGKWCVMVAVAVRLVLLVHATLAVWLVVSLTSRTALWALLAALLLMGVEGVFTVLKRGGHESRWICPCFLAYLAAALPPIWLVELDRLNRFNDALGSSGNLTSLVQVNGLTVPIKLEPEVWVSVMEQALLFLLVLCRWLLPRGDITRHELSQLLFVFMGIASDNMELFELFDETEVRKDRILTYTILAVWSLSLLQFVMVLTSTRSSRKAQVTHDPRTTTTTTSSEGREGGRRGGDQKKKKKRSMLEIIFATEIWSLMFSILVQDGPYAAVRIYTLVRYDLLTYSIIFFICKNLLVICLVLYRLVVIFLYKCSASDKEEEEDEEEEKERRMDKGQTTAAQLAKERQGGGGASFHNPRTAAPTSEHGHHHLRHLNMDTTISDI